MHNYNILEKFIKLQKHIEKTLEQPPLRIAAEENELSFDELPEISHDFNTFDDIARHLPIDDEERIILLFSKLTLYFDAGVLFENNCSGLGVSATPFNDKYCPQIYFNKGQLSTFKNDVQVQIPQISIQQIIKFKNNDLLKRVGLEFLDPQNKLTVLLFKPTSEFAFCVLSSLPDLWLREHAETLFQKLKRSITP